MAELLNVADLEAAKKHDTFHSEVITGKAGGAAVAADIDYATNEVTGQVQKTLPKLLADIDWSPVGLFADGVTFTKVTDFAIDGDGTQWIYIGAYPFTASAGTVPSDPLYQAVHVRDYSLQELNGLTDPSDLAQRHRIKTTVAEIATEVFKVGDRLEVVDRGNFPFDVKAGTANGFKSVNAGSGNMAEIAIDTNNIVAYGGVDDSVAGTGTNNKPVIDYLISLRPITIELPKTNTGVYLYDGVPSAATTDLTGVNLLVGEGVSIYSTGTTNGPFWRKGVKVNKELKSYVAGARYNLYSSPEQYKKPSEQFSKLTHADGNIDQIRPLDFSSSDVRCYELSAWPAGTLNVISPVSATAADLNLGTIPASSFRMAGVPVVAGDMVQAHVATGPVRPCVFVQTDAGYVIVQQAPGLGSYEVQKYENSINTSFSVVDKLFNQNEYRFINASLAIIIFNENSFGIVVNNILVKRVSTSGGIHLAGWGAGFDTANLTINRPSAFYGKKSIGIKELKIVVAGDSTSAETLPPSQAQYMKQYLAGSCGAQVFTLTNLAVGGQTSAQQRTSLLATNILDYDYCMIQVGVNDVQTGVSALTYAQNVIDMIDYCYTNNVVPIVGLPTSWYTQANAQTYSQDGQSTANSIKAASYRNTLMHALGNKGGVLMNSSALEDSGAILAEWLSISSADPRVQDNIHPTALNQMALGMSYAKAIIGHAMNFKPTGGGVYMPKYWFVSGIGATQSPLMTINNNKVTLQWFITRDSQTITEGMTIATLPTRFRPKKTFFTSVVSTTGDSNVLATTKPVGQMQIRDDGQIKLYNIDAAAFFISVNATWGIS